MPSAVSYPANPAWEGESLPPTRASRVVDLSVVKLHISTNREDFPAFEHFTRFGGENENADYHLHCTDLDRDAMDEVGLARLADSTQRARRFRNGYYRGPYFGPPAYLTTRGRSFFVFGRSLQNLVWPYFVKHILTVHAADIGAVHIKAAGFVINGQGTLLVGLGGGGKTVFLTQACLNGATFLANTHMVLHNGMAHGVLSSMRIREDDCFRSLILSHGLQRHLDKNEYTVSPQALFEHVGTEKVVVKNIVVVDFRYGERRALKRISPLECLSFLDQFALGVTSYGLKDDLFLHFGGNLQAYSAYYAEMKAQLESICDSARCYHANIDMLQSSERDATLRELSRA